MYGTSMQSLTLVIWGACRTLDGPGFEPLISKASECDSFEGKEPPRGKFHHNSRTARSRQSCAGLQLIVADVAQYARVVRARLFRRLPWVG